MLNFTELVMHGLLLIFIVPLASASLLRGSPPLTVGPMAKYYAAVPHLSFVGNLFLLTLGANSLNQLALHYGVITNSTSEVLDGLIMAPFFALLLTYFALWGSALWKVRRASPSAE